VLSRKRHERYGQGRESRYTGEVERHAFVLLQGGARGVFFRRNLTRFVDLTLYICCKSRRLEVEQLRAPKRLTAR